MKLLKKNLTLLLLLSVVIGATAQEKQWTLEQCIDYAIENNIEIKGWAYSTQLKEQSLNTSKWSRLPDLNASLGQSFDFGRSPSADGLILQRNSANSSFSVGTNVPLFTGFRIPNEVAAGKLDVQASLESLNKAKESLAILVTSNFLNVLFFSELEKVQEAQVELSSEQLAKTEILVQSGKVPESQLYDAKALLAKDELNLVNAQNDVKLALLALAQNLELGAQVESFGITEPNLADPSETLLGSLLLPEEIYALALVSRPMIKEQEFLLEKSRKDLKVAKAGYYPNLDFRAYYTNGYYHYYNQPTMEQLTFADQLRANQRSSLGVNLSIPVFNRFKTRNNVNSSKINILSHELNLDKSKKDLLDEIQKAYYNAVAAQRKYQSSKESVEASTLSYEYAQEKYDAGKASVFELNEAKTKMVQSLAEQAQSKYEFIFRTKILDFYRGSTIH